MNKLRDLDVYHCLLGFWDSIQETLRHSITKTIIFEKKTLQHSHFHSPSWWELWLETSCQKKMELKKKGSTHACNALTQRSYGCKSTEKPLHWQNILSCPKSVYTGEIRRKEKHFHCRCIKSEEAHGKPPCLNQLEAADNWSCNTRGQQHISQESQFVSCHIPSHR